MSTSGKADSHRCSVRIGLKMIWIISFSGQESLNLGAKCKINPVVPAGDKHNTTSGLMWSSRSCLKKTKNKSKKLKRGCGKFHIIVSGTKMTGDHSMNASNEKRRRGRSAIEGREGETELNVPEHLQRCRTEEGKNFDF